MPLFYVLTQTTNYWEKWIKSSYLPDVYQAQVIRSALALKLHQYEDTGAVIASGTSSLPEYDQSHRTWDYRYCWIRDTYYILNAFNNIGHFEELEKYFQFIQNIILNEKEHIKPLYTITGEQVPDEKILLLEGYLNNKPVRVGNNANYQIQNDVYGQILVSLLPLFIDKRHNSITRQSEYITNWLLDRIAGYMDTPDAGLWELRSGSQFYCNTYLFHWAGSMAGKKIGRILGNKKIVSKSESLVKKSRKYIEKCYNSQNNAYMQAVGSQQYDASTLMLITMNYLNPHSKKSLKHLKAVESELFGRDNLFLRYTHDELGKAENSFLICGFWYVEALLEVGQLEKAREIIERLLKCSNHLGLFSEAADSAFGQWGNFPQSYSHVGLVNSVYKLATKLDKPIFL